MTNGRSRFQPEDVLGYSKHAVRFVWCCCWICLVFSFKLSLPPDAVLSQRLVHSAYTVHTNVIFWHPSCSALRDVRRGSQKSSAAYFQYINTVWFWHTLIIFVVELNQSIRYVNVATLMIGEVMSFSIVFLSCSSYKHGTTLKNNILAHLHSNKWLISIGINHSSLNSKQVFVFFCVKEASLYQGILHEARLQPRSSSDHMEAMIVDLEGIYRTNPLLNVGHTPCHLHHNHSQIIHCKKRPFGTRAGTFLLHARENGDFVFYICF